MSEPVIEPRRPPLPKLVGFVVLLCAVSWALGAFGAYPWRASDPGAAVVRVALRHVASFAETGTQRSQEEIEKLPRHMRPVSPERGRTGRRVDTTLRLEVDGRSLLERIYSPSGLRHDGPTFAYEEIMVAPGRHALIVSLSEAVPAEAAGRATRRWEARQDVEVPPGRALLIEFSEASGFVVR